VSRGLTITAGPAGASRRWGAARPEVHWRLPKRFCQVLVPREGPARGVFDHYGEELSADYRTGGGVSSPVNAQAS